MLRHFLPFCTSRRKTPTTFTPWTGKIPPASSTIPPAAPAPVPKDTTPPSPPWAPKPASRQDGPPPVRTEEILSDTQKPLISLHGIRGFIFYILSIQATPSTLSEGISTAVLFSPPIIYRSFSKSSLAPAAIRRNQPILLQVFPSSPCLGILFSPQFPGHFRLLHQVFVPMFGDSFFTSEGRGRSRNQRVVVFVPMFGDSFFTGENVGSLDSYQSCFRPHVWGFFFHKKMEKIVSEMKKYGFSPPCLGILFSQSFLGAMMQAAQLFSSPCLGILFSHVDFYDIRENAWGGFRPHVWGFFFHSRPGVPHGVGSL